MKKLLRLAALEAAFFFALAPLIASAQSYPAPTFNSLTLVNPLTAANGGTGTTTSTGSGANVLGTAPTIASPVFTTGITATGLVKTTDLATQAANTVLANATGSTASPTAYTMPGCNTTSSALIWTPGAGFQCSTAINAAALGGATFAAPPAIGSTTPNTGAFTNLTATGTVSFPSASLPTTALSGLGGGVQTGLTTNVNSGNGFTTWNSTVSVAGSLNPGFYGAAGNGTTDDTTAIQNWVNGVASQGLTAYCSAGTYKVTKTINLAAQALKIMGPGGTSCAIKPSLPAGPTVSGTAAGATYNPGSATSIRLTVSSTTNIGTAIEVGGIGGTTEANGAWPAVVIDSTHVDIVGPTFTHAYTSGGQVYLPVFAVVPSSTPNTATQPQLDMSGVYMAPPAINATTTDAIIVTGGAFNSPGSSINVHENVFNGYHRGVLLWQSYAPIFRYNYFYNILGAAVVANQDISFSNALFEKNQLFSNGLSVLEPSVIVGGPQFVENPTFLSNQWSGNNGGLNLAGNVNGAMITGNYLENNPGFNLGCTGSSNNGAQIQGNWLAYNSGTNVTSIASCTGALFSGNWLSNQTITLASGSVVLSNSNTLSGTAAINYPTATAPTITSAQSNGVSMTSGGVANLTSVSLGAGNWECAGSTFTHPAATTTQTYNAMGLSTVASVFPGGVPGEAVLPASLSAGNSAGLNTGPVYYAFGSTTTLYLVAQVNFSVSTLTIDGDIHCHRIF